MKKIAIVGSGVMGRVLTLAFAKNMPDVKIDIYDKDIKSGKNSCSYQAAGMLCPISELTINSIHTYDFGNDSVKLWQDLLFTNNKCLATKNNIIRKSSTLFLAHNNDTSELKHIQDRLVFFAKENPDIQKTYKNVNSNELSILEPNLTNGQFINRGLLISDEAAVHVPNFFKFTNNFNATQTNITCYEFDIDKIIRNKVYCNGQINEYSHVFDCRGFSIKNRVNDLYGMRGEAIILQHQDIKINHIIRLAHPRHTLYIIPRGDGIFYLGATSICSEDYSPISVQSIMEFMSMAMVVDSRFSEARLIKTLTSVRPTSLDDKPIIKTSGGNTVVNGLSRHGYLFAPKIANQLINYFKKVMDEY